jgi:transposase InsO family protein
MVTREIVGWHVGSKRSWPTTVQASRAGLPKSKVGSGRKKSANLMRRAQERIIVDNGLPFYSMSRGTNSEQLRFELLPAAVPCLKGMVERFFGRVARELGTSRPGGTDNVTMTTEQLEQLVQSWVARHHNFLNPHDVGSAGDGSALPEGRQ